MYIELLFKKKKQYNCNSYNKLTVKCFLSKQQRNRGPLVRLISTLYMLVALRPGHIMITTANLLNITTSR